MRSLGEALAGYVPARIVDRLLVGEACAPFVERFPAALLFADISGSVALAERLATRGPAGAEEFSRLLNTYLGALIDVVTEHGGDVVKFAGDGLFALWPAAASDELCRATGRAAQCALEVQRATRGARRRCSSPVVDVGRCGSRHGYGHRRGYARCANGIRDPRRAGDGGLPRRIRGTAGGGSVDGGCLACARGRLRGGAAGVRWRAPRCRSYTCSAATVGHTPCKRADTGCPARYHQRRAQATLDMPGLRTETPATVEA